MDVQRIEIPTINLQWTDWHPWRKFQLDARTDPGSISVPNESGVYEARMADLEECLTIGRASNLRMRVKQGLVKGKVPHSAGEDIRDKEDYSKIVIRWAITDRPAAVEEELHRKHIVTFGRLPKYTDRT